MSDTLDGKTIKQAVDEITAHFGPRPPSGRELDAAVDARWFGRKWYQAKYAVINGIRHDGLCWFQEGDGSPDDPPPGYSTAYVPRAYHRDMNAAMQVVKAVRAAHPRWHFHLIQYRDVDGQWSASFGNECPPRDSTEGSQVFHDDPATAICLAALEVPEP